jgi:hypothetical protein
MKLSIQIILISLALVLNWSCSKDKTTSYDRFNLKGKVKSFKENVYVSEKVEDTRQKGAILATTEYFFDEKGYNVRNDQYFGSTELSSYSQFTYDKGDLTSEENFNKSGNLQYTTTFKKVTDEEIDYERMIGSGEKVTTGKNYFKNKKLIRTIMTMYNKSREYEVITIDFNYNSNGDIESRTQSKKNGERVTIYFKYSDFDTQGNWQQCILFGKEGEMEPYNLLTREYVYY